MLLHRDGKNTRLTELGRTMRAEFEAIIVNFDRATLLAESITKGQSSALNVGLSNTLGRLPVTDFLHRVATELGGTRLLVHEALTKELAALVLSGALDCCICSDCDTSNTKLKVVPLYEERLLLACAKTHPLAALEEVPVEQLHAQVYLDRLNCELRVRAAKALGDQGVFMAPHVQSDREERIQHMVASGLGVALMPEFTAYLDNIVTRPVIGLNLKRTVQFISVLGTPPAKSVRAVEQIASTFPWPG